MDWQKKKLCSGGKRKCQNDYDFFHIEQTNLGSLGCIIRNPF